MNLITYYYYLKSLKGTSTFRKRSNRLYKRVISSCRFQRYTKFVVPLQWHSETSHKSETPGIPPIIYRMYRIKFTEAKRSFNYNGSDGFWSDIFCVASYTSCGWKKEVVFIRVCVYSRSPPGGNLFRKTVK